MIVRPEDIVRDDIRAMSAYAVAESAGMVKLDAMENPYTLPEMLRRQIAELVAATAVNRYPDPAARALKARLREVMGIPAQSGLMLGNGSDELIQIIIQACARHGATVMAPEPTFTMYRQYTRIAGLRYVGVALEADFSIDIGRFLAAMREHRPAVVFLSYPNNPTGNLFSRDAMERVLAEATGLVVVDEAYQPFAEGTFLTRLAEFPGMLVLRTVSKLGMAGIRLGYAVAGPEWIAQFDKVRSPYNVNVLTQVVAERVLAQNHVLEQQASEIRLERTRLGAALSAMPGLVAYPSSANFILARLPDAGRAVEGLRRRNILVKNLHGVHPLLEQCVRFTVGTPQENDLLIAALLGILSERTDGTGMADRVP